MKFTNLIPEFILDEDNKTDIIYLENGEIRNGFFYRKCRYLNRDFNGNKIDNPNNYIRTSALWFCDLKAKSKIEIVPFGNYDIYEISLIGNYLYYIKATDKDNDGCLENDDFGGDIFRINIETLKNNFCCNIGTYDFHGFEAADEQFLVFRSEDQLPDTVEEIFIDLVNKRKAVIRSSFDNYPGNVTYKYAYDESDAIGFIIINEYIGEDELGLFDNKLHCFNWTNFINMLDWEDTKCCLET